MLSSEFARALESSPDAMVVVNSCGSILFANRRVSALFGYGSGEVTGQSVELLMPERFRSSHVTDRARFTSESRARPMGAGLDLFARRKDNSEFPVEISLSPLREADEILVVAAIRDVTDRKRIQSELMAAREAADRANQAKSRFLATASHDLRQPLQSLALLNGTLRRLVREPDAVAALSHQDQAIGAMSRLLNALLDISKLESGVIKPEPTDFTVAALFEEMRHEFASLASNKGLTLQVEPSPDCIRSDPSLVGQILRNLITNAIRYTRAGSVRLCSLPRSGAIRIEVLDTGIGIPADQLPYIYDEFYQVGVKTPASREGYGLGLSIVRRLVKLLELKLEVQSEVGKGSVFALELPRGRAQVGARGERAEPAPIAQPAVAPVVLLVEDDPAVRDATRLLLKVEGYCVLAARSLAEARERIREHPRIDLLITDYHLDDGETGTQVIASLREVLGPDLKAVLVTGDTSSAVRDLQCDSHLRVASKPINADELLASLRALLAI
jgi:two-component system, sensor histidine kinase